MLSAYQFFLFLHFQCNIHIHWKGSMFSIPRFVTKASNIKLKSQFPARAVFRGWFFSFFVKVRLLRTGRDSKFSRLRFSRPRLRIFTVFPCAGKITELGITKIFRHARALVSFFYNLAGDGIFFFVKDCIVPCVSLNFSRIFLIFRDEMYPFVSYVKIWNDP